MYVPDQQAQAFKARIAERLSLDPGQITDLRVEVIGGDDKATVTWSGQASIDIQTIVDLLNGHGPKFSRVPGQH